MIVPANVSLFSPPVITVGRYFFAILNCQFIHQLPFRWQAGNQGAVLLLPSPSPPELCDDTCVHSNDGEPALDPSAAAHAAALTSAARA